MRLVNEVQMSRYSYGRRPARAPRRYVDDATFTFVWATSDSQAEVAQKLALTTKQVENKAYNLREKGVQLAAFSGYGRSGRPLKDRGWNKVNVLNALAGAITR
jgi:hypothetical protein